MTRCSYVAVAFVALAGILAPFIVSIPARAAEATTGTIVARVLSADGAPLGGARVAVVSASARYTGTTDARGRVTVLGVSPDTYTISAEHGGYDPGVQSGVLVLPGAVQTVTFRLARSLAEIGRVRSTVRAIAVGSPADTFTVSGEQARATFPVASSSGLGNYTQGTVQGAIAAVPGVEQDTFANAIVRGGKVRDVLFDYDSVPVTQGIVAEPGGNIVGAQLATTGTAATTVTLAGYGAEGENALGGVVDLIPAVGTYPGRTSLELVNGGAPQDQQIALQRLWATPDLRWRYAISATAANQRYAYGDGRSFYPAEAGTFGLALQSRAQSSFATNVHHALTAKDDLSFTAIAGTATYGQYDTPFAGETFGAFDGQSTRYPGATNPNATVDFPSTVQGSYGVFKLQWLRTAPRSLSRVQLYESTFGSTAGGPFWDDLGFPDGAISLFAQQGARLSGLSFDVDHIASERHHLRYGLDYRIDGSYLDQLVPTADEHITSHPTLFTRLFYLGDTWSFTPRVDLTATARWSTTHIVPSDGSPYDVGALDPHASLTYRLGERLALRGTYDHTTVAPAPLEAERVDTANPAPFVQLAPQTANEITASLEGGGRTQFRLTYYANLERNRIDVLPVNYRSIVNTGANPSAIGIPTNAGVLRAHGVELWAKRGGLTFDANYGRAFSSSASQFAYNGLNAYAVAAGHLFPVGYVPDLTASLSYELRAGPHVRITPALSYESGYPYGNGTMVWVAGPDGKPAHVPNDNHVNPGFNYYFLQDPALPYDRATNPYVATLGTPEGADPNTLRSPPKTLVSLHVEADLTPRLSAMLDVFNLLSTSTPTQYQVNPYLVGPPGYQGGNPAYAAWYGQQLGALNGYALGNGVPTNDGTHQALPWNYGTAGYVPEAYPLARSFEFRLRYRI